MEKLRSYLADAKINRTKFARMVGTTPSAVSRWVAGKTVPSDAAKIRIAKATGGDVPVTAWFEQVAA